MKKLRNNRGETIVETLVALTIAAVGLLMLASMINASSKMIANSRLSVNKYVAAENMIAEQMTETPEVGEDEGAETENKGTVTIIPKTVEGVSLPRKLTDGSDEEIIVEYYINDQARGDEVKAYNKVVSYKEWKPIVIDENEEEGGVPGGE